MMPVPPANHIVHPHQVIGGKEQQRSLRELRLVNELALGQTVRCLPTRVVVRPEAPKRAKKALKPNCKSQKLAKTYILNHNIKNGCCTQPEAHRYLNSSVLPKKNKSAASAKAFLHIMDNACPIRIKKYLPTTAWSEQIDSLHRERACRQESRAPTAWVRVPTGVAPIRSKAIASKVGSTCNRHRSIVAIYNYYFSKTALLYKAPIQVMKNWYIDRPELLAKRPDGQS